MPTSVDEYPAAGPARVGRHRARLGIDPEVPLADQLGALVELQAEGKIGRVGL